MKAKYEKELNDYSEFIKKYQLEKDKQIQINMQDIQKKAEFDSTI